MASLNSGAHEELLESDIDIDWHIMTYSVFIIETCFGNYINFSYQTSELLLVSSHPTFECLLKILLPNYFFIGDTPTTNNDWPLIYKYVKLLH